MAYLDPMRDMTVNIFSRKQTFESFHTTEVSWFLYRDELREWMPKKNIQWDLSDRESEILVVSPSQCANLMRHSSYFNGWVSVQKIDTAQTVYFPVERCPEHDYDLALAIKLLWVNCREDCNYVPDFQTVDIKHFVGICDYYGLLQMFDKIDQHMVNTRLHYFPEYFETLYNLYGSDHPKVLNLVNDFAFRFDHCFTYRLGDVLDTLSPKECRVVNGKRLVERLHIQRSILPGLVRSFVQNPRLRASKPFLVCHVCELPISERRSLNKTLCCSEPIHNSCLQRASPCEICSHETSSLKTFDFMSIADVLRDRKNQNWSVCRFHANCCMYMRGDFKTTHHVPRSEVDSFKHMTCDVFINRMKQIYMREMVARWIDRNWDNVAPRFSERIISGIL